MNYMESKQKLDAIRQKYGCSGEIILRTAIQMVVEYGQNAFKDPSWYENQLNAIYKKHEAAELSNQILFMTKNFEKKLMECAKELSEINAYDFLTYIQREIYLGNGEIGEPDYQRAMQIIRDCLCYLADCYGSYRLDKEETLGKFRNIGLKDEEICYFGWDELLDYEEECDDEIY